MSDLSWEVAGVRAGSTGLFLLVKPTAKTKKMAILLAVTVGQHSSSRVVESYMLM